MLADARPQARKNRRRIRWNTLRFVSGRERRRCLQIVARACGVGGNKRGLEQCFPLYRFARAQILDEDEVTIVMIKTPA
jgi:hypothetical protein